jgi:hypothetical protein
VDPRPRALGAREIDDLHADRRDRVGQPQAHRVGQRERSCGNVAADRHHGRLGFVAVDHDGAHARVLHQERMEDLAGVAGGAEDGDGEGVVLAGVHRVLGPEYPGRQDPARPRGHNGR